MRLGYACMWGRDRQRTWSGTPWALLQALRHQTDVVDLGVDLPDVVRASLKGTHLRRAGGSWVSAWRQSAALDRLMSRRLATSVRREAPDTVLQVHDLARVEVPYLIYQDLSYDAFLEVVDVHPDLQMPWLSPRRLQGRRARQMELYEGAGRVVAMSQWLADHLVGVTGLDPERVAVVRAGTNAPVSPSAPRTLPGRRLLFVGRAFARKGGDLVVAAFERLRSQHDPTLSLTIAGPAHWPLRGPLPAGVTFLGDVDHATVLRLYLEHDVFVMPSRFEAFGIVFGEALVAGVPCVARDAYAMPELVRDGLDGRLIRGENVDGLAEAILAVLDDEPLRARVAAGRHDAARRFSWDRAATEMVAVSRSVVEQRGGPD